MSGVQHIDVDWAGRPIRIEHAFVGEASSATAPLLVFLHEGLGSLAMWKDFPARLCAAAGCRGLVFSRPGYGRSTPRAADETWGVDFMHRQAFEVLPALLRALSIGEPYWLFGHSDGGSIALLHAARFADQVAGAIVLAPHIFVEDLSVASIEQARTAYEQGDLKKGLAKYHDDPDSAFWGWNRIWLDPAFRRWRIGPAVQQLRCPLLAVQGIDDEYGTLEQIRGIKRLAPHTQLLELPACGHSPHRDQPEALIEAVASFLTSHGDQR
jgi:pimeloyl-ACP methyl ester carboxylesterase